MPSASSTNFVIEILSPVSTSVPKLTVAPVTVVESTIPEAVMFTTPVKLPELIVAVASLTPALPVNKLVNVFAPAIADCVPVVLTTFVALVADVISEST